MKHNWLHYFIEFVTVALGILLAFALNTNREMRRERELASQYLEGIRQEIAVNLQEIESKLDYHELLLSNLRGDRPDTVRMVIRPANLKDHAWIIAENSTFQSHTDYEVYMKLIEVYSTQRTLSAHNGNAGELMTYLNLVGPLHMLAADTDTEFFQLFNKEGKKSWIPIFEDMTSYENRLRTQYREVLDLIAE